MLGAVWGCAGASQYMREVPTPAPIAATADKATVVFLRPSGIAFGVNFAILDQQAHWVGDAVAQSHFAVQLPPGEYMFVAWAENTAALRASVGPGRIYYVEVIPYVGAFSAQVGLEALTPRNPDWAKVSGWLSTETKRLESLPVGAASMQERRDEALKRVASAQESWNGYSPEDKAKRTLALEDGVAPAGVVPPPAAPPPVAPPPPQVVAAAPALQCNPACAKGSVCAGPEPHCVSACNPACGPKERCTDAGACVAEESPSPRVARAGAAGSESCVPACRKGFVCTSRGQCVSACNPPCAAGERCTEAGECVAAPAKSQ
jgi:hypothetical protein